MITGCGLSELCLLQLCSKRLSEFCVCVHNFSSGKEKESAALEPSALPDHLSLVCKSKILCIQLWLLHKEDLIAGSCRIYDGALQLLQEVSSPDVTMISRSSRTVHRFCIFLFFQKIWILHLFSPTTRATLPTSHHPFWRFAKKNAKRASKQNGAHACFFSPDRNGRNFESRPTNASRQPLESQLCAKPEKAYRSVNHHCHSGRLHGSSERVRHEREGSLEAQWGASSSTQW